MFSFINKRPPLVVFFLCLFTLAITLFCFAFYIKNTERVPDTDRNHDWLLLLKHFNSLDTCLESHQDSPKEIHNDFIEMTTVQALVSINNTDFIKKVTSVKGFLAIDNWHTNCPKNYAKPSHLEIYFDIPEVAKTNVTTFDTCVSIRGPEEYLPKFSKPNCMTSVGEYKKKVEVYLSSADGEFNDFCKSELLTKLTFHPQDKGNFANFLNENEKSLIYVHLLWTSYSLSFVLLIMVIYMTLQRERIVEKYLQKPNPHS